MLSGSRPARRHLTLRAGHHARGAPAQRLAQQPDVLGSRAAAAADDVDQARLAVLAQDLGGLRRALVVLAEGVRQPRVGVGAHVAIGDRGQLLDVGAQQAAAERTVQAHEQWLGMADGVPERLGGLPGQHPAGGIRDGARDRQRQRHARLVEQRQRGVDRRLGVERVDHGLDEQKIGTAEQQAARGFQVSGNQFIEGDCAESRVVDVRGHRTHAVGGPERTRHEARRAAARRGLVRCQPCEARGAVVELGHQRHRGVIRLRDRVGVERVGLDDVGARAQVGAVHVADDVRSREREDVVVAAQVAAVRTQPLAAEGGLVEAPLLDHRAHRPVEQHDALARQVLQARDAFAARGLVQRLDGIRTGHGLLCRRRRCALAVGVRRVGAGTHARAAAATAAARGARGRSPSAWQMA